MAEPRRAGLEEAEHAARELARTLKSQTPEGWAFIVLLCALGNKDGRMTYISTVERSHAIRVMEEWISLQKHGPDTSEFVDTTDKNECWCCGTDIKLMLREITGPHRSVSICTDCLGET